MHPGRLCENAAPALPLPPLTGWTGGPRGAHAALTRPLHGATVHAHALRTPPRALPPASAQLADEAVCIGEAASSESYLNIPNLLSAAISRGATAIHPVSLLGPSDSPA